MESSEQRVDRQNRRDAFLAHLEAQGLNKPPNSVAEYQAALLNAFEAGYMAAEVEGAK
jgi:hypothetical protein